MKTLTNTSSRRFLNLFLDHGTPHYTDSRITQLITLLRQTRRQLGNVLKGIKNPLRRLINPKSIRIATKEEVLDTSITKSKRQIQNN